MAMADHNNRSKMATTGYIDPDGLTTAEVASAIAWLKSIDTDADMPRVRSWYPTGLVFFMLLNHANM